MSDGLTFASPQWLYLILLVVPIIAIKAIAAKASREGLAKITSQRLREHLVTARRPLGDWGRFSLQLIGLAFIAIALARPQMGYIEEMTHVEGRNIIIAIDTSRSMLAEDISPNSRTSRLTQAKLAAIDLIDQLPDDRIGLIAFAGSAFMQAPLTPDHNAVIETIEQLNTFVIERGGTNLAAAIDLARERLGATDAARNALILFTDGDDLEGVALKSAEKARKDNVLIITIGVGSQTPSIVPDPEAERNSTFLKDKGGELVKSSMDAESLEKIAKATNGTFINLKGGLMNQQLVNDVLANISYSQSEDKLKRTPHERFALPLMLGLACVAGGFIATLWGSRPASRQAIAAILMLGFFAPLGADAASPEAAAYEAFEEGDFATAKTAYDEAERAAKSLRQRQQLSFGRGAAAYQNGDFDEAIEAFAGSLVSEDPALQERVHYNLANTLFRKGEKLWNDKEKGGMKQLDQVIREFKDAADHYRSSLEINAENADAKINLDIVEDLLEKLKDIQQEQQQQKEEEQKKEEEKKEEDEKKKEDEKEGDSEKSDEQGEEKSEEQAEEKSEDEEKSGDDPSEEGDSGEETEKQEGGEAGEENEEAEGGSEGDDEAGSSEPGEENPGEESATEEAEPQEVDPDDEVDEKTGYSKNEARENLRELSDEQGDLGLLRRRRLRQRSRSYKDW